MKVWIVRVESVWRQKRMLVVAQNQEQVFELFEFQWVLPSLLKFLLLWQNPTWLIFILLIQAINKSFGAMKLTLKKQLQDWQNKKQDLSDRNIGG